MVHYKKRTITIENAKQEVIWAMLCSSVGSYEHMIDNKNRHHLDNSKYSLQTHEMFIFRENTREEYSWQKEPIWKYPQAGHLVRIMF